MHALKRTWQGILVFGLLGTSTWVCAPDSAQRIRPMSPPALVQEQEAESATESGVTDSEPSRTEQVDTALPQRPTPWALSLTRSSPRPLPPPDPDRYRSWREKRRIWVGQSHLSVSRLAPDGRHALVISQMEFAIRVYDLATGRLVQRHVLPDYEVLDHADAVFWPDTSRGLMLLVGGKDGLSLRDARTFEALERYSAEPIWRIEWSPDERVLVTTSSAIPAQTSRVSFYVRDESGSSAALHHRQTIDTPERLDAFALSADSRLFVSTFYPSERVVLTNLESGVEVWSVRAPRYGNAVALSPDGRAVAVGGDHLRLFDVGDPTRQGAFQAYQNNIDQVVFSPSGDAVFTSSYDGKIRILKNDLSSPELRLLRELSHTGTANVYMLSFNPDGSRLLSASGDQTLRLWGR